MSGDRSGGNPIAQRIMIAVTGGVVSGIALAVLTENGMAFFLGVGICLLVIALLRP